MKIQSMPAVAVPATAAQQGVAAVSCASNRDMRVVREEIFGPGVCPMPIDDDDLDRIARTANDTASGSSADLTVAL